MNNNLKRKALESVDASKVIRLTRDLIRVSSENPPGSEKAISMFIAEELRSIGLSTTVYDFKPGRPNVVGILHGEDVQFALMLNGHMDTVPVGDRNVWSVDPLAGDLINGRIYGRGASDMKSSLAAMIHATETLVNIGIKPKKGLMLAFVSDEEVTGFGTKDLIERGYKTEFAIVGEPTSLRVQTSHKGVIWLKVVVRGKAAHASVPEEGVNAITEMVKLCSKIEKLSTLLSKSRHPLLGVPTINVTTIRGGTKVNIIPDFCEITIDRRILPNENIEAAKYEIIKTIGSLKEGDSKVKPEVEVITTAEPSEVSSSELIVKTARGAVKEVTGVDLGVTGFPATCDMRFLVNQANIPTVILGPGTLSKAHAADECVEVHQVVNATKIYLLMMLKLLC
jgi:acetylornithine deacetylase/succinyl-diaminopimelate desuccinylase family protein